MDPSAVQRRLGRRARSHTSQENLIKDSSSDVSPRESTSSTLADRRRQRRAGGVHRSPTNQEQYDNQAFTHDERPLPPTIERLTDDNEEDAEEENIQNADRLVKNVAKEHQRKINEVQQQNKKPKKKSDETDHAQQDVDEQIREHQENLLKHVGDTDDDRVLPLEPLTTTTDIRRGTSTLDQILERAKRTRPTKSFDEDQLSTLGSSRRLGGTVDLKLQRMLRQQDTRVDASQISSPAITDRPTRFDFQASRAEQIHRELEDKRRGRDNRWKEIAKKQIEDIPPPSERDDFFIKVWPEEKPEVKEPTTTTPVTTADNVAGEEPKTTDGTTVQPPAPTTTDTTIAALAEKQPLLPTFGEAQPTLYQRADRLYDEDEQREFENQKFKYVIGERLSLQEKLGDGIVEPRSLEDEGIFVGKRPVVPANLIHRAEKRILQECATENKPMDRWFGPDGAIVTLPDPTKFVPTRPLIDDLFDPALNKEFYKAYIVDSEHGVSSDPIGGDRYRLDIDLGTLIFLHHHFMSTEHVLAMRLKQMYEHYTVRTQQRIVQQLSDKIKALKVAENNCRTLYEQNRYSESSSPEEYHNRLISYQNELRQTREQRCNEMRLDRQLLERLLSTWKKIKDIRRTNGYTTTSVRLIIKQISGKKTKHYEQMQQQIEEHIEDEIRLADEEYQRAKEAYQQIVKKRKLQGIRKKKAKKDLDGKRDNGMTTGTVDGDYDQGDINVLNEEEIPLPDKPEPRKPDEIRTKVLMKYQNAIRPSDEPEILLELVYSEPISTDSECSARERARRYQVQTSSNILARILINGKVMADTPAVSLTSEFEGQFGQIFPIYVFRTPETIKIELYETSVRFRAPLAELYLPVPEPTVTSENYKLQSYEFSSNILREFNPNQTTAVGAGFSTPAEYDLVDSIYLSIEGLLNASVAWGVQDGVVLVPSDYATSKAARNRQMGGGMRGDIGVQAAKLSNMKNLIEWIKQSNLDPYDPENAFLINLTKDYAGTRTDTRYEMNALQHFRLWIDESDQVDDKQKQMDVDNSLRFKLLQARKENLPDFRDYKQVPTYDYLVRKEHGVFKSYMARQKEAASAETGDYQVQDKPQTRIDAVRRQGEKQLRKMREQVLARFTLTTGRKTFHQMVVEESIPNIQALRGYLSKLYIEPSRPLYPTARRTEQKKVTNLSIGTTRDVYILVNLISAIDLPMRREALDSERDRGRTRGKQGSERSTLVRPYVEIQFQKRTYRTSVVDGPNPSWNEELRIPFRPPDNDFDASSLQRCRDILYINIFDHLDVDLPTTDRERDQIIRKRIARNWLGSVKIPFSNIYVNGRLEGNYRVSVPNPLLGYAREKFTQTRIEPTSNAQIPASVLRMFITMEPLLAPPETVQQSFDSTESAELLERARTWAEELYKKFPDREYKATVSDINGRVVFIPRYLHPLPPPQLGGAGDTTPATAGTGTDNQIQYQRLARFVSLIPFLADTVTFPGNCDIWETSDQFLRTMAGDDEEHAVLLNNYFLKLGKRSWVAIGESINSGPCSFVLTKDDNQAYPTCWSVSDGQDVSTFDTWNPIRSIYLLANQDNIWANIQDQDAPSRMFFDVENSRHWKPFFTRPADRERFQFVSVQPNDLHYEATPIKDVNALQTHIQNVLREKFIEWREPNVTRWSWNCQRQLEAIVTRKEMNLILGRTDTSIDNEPELAEFQKTYDITGFPLQMPYTTVRSIVDAVYATKIFEHPINDIEFALAVHIHPYPNNILAVWIYVAHLMRKIQL